MVVATRPSVDSLCDALTNIQVPADKARAVVDAMERDMLTHLSTKSDLQLLSKDIAALRSDMSKDMEALRMSMTIRLGSMMLSMFVLFAGVILGVLRVWL